MIGLESGNQIIAGGVYFAMFSYFWRKIYLFNFLFTAGDRVPADVRLFEANQLEIDESSFTGEIEPVRKHSRVIEGNSTSQKSNVAWMGTLVRSGNGKGIVYATGISSEFGSIFQMMKEVS